MRRLGPVVTAVALWLWWLGGVAAAGQSLAVTGASDRWTLIFGLVFAAGFGVVAMRLRRN